MNEWFILKIWKGWKQAHFLRIEENSIQWVGNRKLATPLRIDWIGQNVGEIYLEHKPESIEILLVKGTNYE